MKSSTKQLETRGFLPDNFALDSCNFKLTEKLEMLSSKIPKERTLAARLLSNEKGTCLLVVELISALVIEKKLYPKIEISKTLAGYGSIAVKPLIEQLGCIGNNQHKCVPANEFKKTSYPLPRDIAARILAQIGEPAMAELLEFINLADEKQLSEAIDAIGFITFYNQGKGVFQKVKTYYELNSQNDLIKWKILRACSGLPESTNFLEEEFQKLTNPRLKVEIKRSIALANKKIPVK